MNYFVPNLSVAPDLQSLERFGGHPIGLAEGQWPKCSECNGSLSFIAQFNHDDERLNLGSAGRRLFIFMCNHDPGMCSTWEAFSGANKCLVVDASELDDEINPLPADNPVVENFVQVVGWLERDDDLSSELAPKFLDDDLFLYMEDEVLEKVTWSTRLGGFPRWLQSPNDGPGSDWRFLGQLDSTHSFIEEPAQPHPWISIDEEKFEGRSHIGAGPNFGFGIAYLFARDGKERPEVVMLWQR